MRGKENDNLNELWSEMIDAVAEDTHNGGVTYERDLVVSGDEPDLFETLFGDLISDQMDNPAIGEIPGDVKLRRCASLENGLHLVLEADETWMQKWNRPAGR